MSRRFPTSHAAPTADVAVPAATSAPQCPAVSSLAGTSDAPAPSGRTAGRPAPVRLEDFGDILTDRDLCLLLRVSPRWAERRRVAAHAAGLAPNLPASLPGMRYPRYRKDDVASWLRTGSSKHAELAPLRRIS